jgi:hypothetical protein
LDEYTRHENEDLQEINRILHNSNIDLNRQNGYLKLEKDRLIAQKESVAE